MGTRCYTEVSMDNEIKVTCQYGQWDGYIEQAGKTIFNFLMNKEKVELLKSLFKSKVRFADFEGKDLSFIEDYNKNIEGNDDKRTPDQRNWFDRFITRDVGYQILDNIVDYNEEYNEIILKDRREDFDETQYQYIINLDNNTIKISSYGKELIVSIDELSPEKTVEIKKFFDGEDKSDE